MPVLGSQPAGDVSTHKPGGRLPLLSARPAVTPARGLLTICCLVNRGTIRVSSLPETVTRQRRDCDLNPGPLRYSKIIAVTLFDCRDQRSPDFYPRDTMLARVLAVALSVCLSVTSRCSIKRDERINPVLARRLFSTSLTLFFEKIIRVLWNFFF